MKIVTVAQMQELEREADQAGWSYQQMMNMAGYGLAEVVEAFYGYDDQHTAVGLVGSGNNGGDTLIALGELSQNGWDTLAYLLHERKADDPVLEEYVAEGGKIALATEDGAWETLDEWLSCAGVVLDGLLGTGVKLPLRDDVSSLLAYVKAFPDLPPVVAVDCPSGVDCDSGAAADESLEAEITVCMAAVKSGLLRSPAAGLSGMLHVVDIGLPGELTSWKEITMEAVDRDMALGWLPQRPADAHKGTFGTVCVMGGSMAYTGAPLLAGRGAYRMGAGLVKIAIPLGLHPAVASALPEAIWALLPDEEGAIAEAAVKAARKALVKVTALVLGPGMGDLDTTGRFVKSLLAGDLTPGMGFAARPMQEEKTALPPTVVDADGLRHLAKIDRWWELGHTLVLTPHPGEMAALTGLDMQAIQQDRLNVAREFAARWKAVVVLKGANTVVAGPDGSVHVIPISTPALARAGTGDVLAGMIGSLLAQGVAPFEAASSAAWIHASAGLAAAELLGTTQSVLASDVIQAIPSVLR